MTFLREHPQRILVFLISVCAFAFWATIPLPRVDNQLVGSDGISYYVYLPSLWLDGDVDFTDEYAYFFPDRQFHSANPPSLPPNKFAIGPALLWSPFFLLAHGLVLCLNLFGAGLPADGYGYLYQAMTLSGSIVYGGAAVWLTYRLVEKMTAPDAALLATVWVVFSGNLVYYMTAEPSMSHALSAFASSLFFYTWWQRRQHTNVSTAWLYGLLGGLMALIRPQDGLFLSLPFLAQLAQVWSPKRGPEKVQLLSHWLRNVGVAGVGALLVFSPQLLVWYSLSGSFLSSGYTSEPFYWRQPQLVAVLFSAHRGLFLWHPIFFIALVGLWSARRFEKEFAVLGLFAFSLQWYVISSWHSWEQGDAFGGRMFIGCLPIFAFGLASCIQGLKKRHAPWLIYGAGSGLLVWNFLLFLEYRFSLVWRREPPGWWDLTLGRITFLMEKFAS